MKYRNALSIGNHNVSIIMEKFMALHISFLIRYLLFLNPATNIFVDFAVSVHTFISKRPAPSFTLSLTAATYFIMIYLHVS